MDKVGKKFENKFKEDFLKTIPNSTIDRLYDTTNGYFGNKNVCDYIGFKAPNIFYLECKTIKGKSFPLSNLSQYDKLTYKVGIEGVRVGVVIWYYEQDKVVYVPISTITQMKKDDFKSISLKTIEEKLYNIIEIPSTKKRTFMDSDYSILLTLKEGE